MTLIVNAAPMTIFNGVNDQSTVALPLVPEDLPTHLPKIYLYTKKGPTDPQLVSGASMTQMYHADSFDPTKPYCTHATILANLINSQGNSMMVQRLKPADAGPNASLRISLDLLPSQIPVYQRNSDGTYTLDENGDKITTGSHVNGYVAKWVVGAVPEVNGESTFGAGTAGAGDQTSSSSQSIRYPIMDLEAPFFGADGNNFGLRMWADTATGATPIDSRILTNEKVYPFRAQIVYRPDSLTTPSIVSTQTATQFIDFCLKPQTMDSNTEAQLYIGDVLIQSYQNLDDPANPPTYGPFGRMYVYNNNVQSILQLVYETESNYFEVDGDFQGVSGEEYLFNLLSGVSSTGVPYTSYVINTSDSNAVRMSKNSTMYAQGGSDGTMNDGAFDALVAEAIADYASPTSVLLDSAKYPESIFYDSGFTLDTKKALTAFISQRKDTFLVLSTHDVSGPALTAAQESSLAVALRTAMQLYPESEYFGTPVMRGMIVGRSGRLLQSAYTKRLPLTLEIAHKAAAYMGAGNGVWKSGFAFDDSPLNQVSLFTDINVTFTPAPVRNKDWDAGLVWVQHFGRRSLFFPAFKTVYDNDTSVLNSFFTAMICVELEKVGERAWRTFTGRSNLSNAQYIERVNQFVIENTNGRFDKRVTIIPETYFSQADIARGFSWSLNIKVFAPNMKTVMTLSITAERLSSLPSST